MLDILKTSYYNNTVLEWATAMLIVFGFFILGKASYKIGSKLIKGLTSKTKSQVDDVAIDLLEEPAVGLLMIFGVWLGTQSLNMSEEMVSFIGNMIQFSVFIIIAWGLTRLVEALFEMYLIPLAKKTENSLDDHLMPFIQKGVKIIIWSLSIIVALNNAGFDVAALIAGLGLGGLALAMAAKDSVSNIFGGFTILTDKPFTLNDRVLVCGFDGVVADIGIRSTRIRKLDGREVTIPNSKFIDTPVENISSEPSRKVSVDLGLTYDTSPEKLQLGLDLLATIIKETEGVEEKNIIYFSGFGDFSMNIKLIYYITKGSDIAETQNKVNFSILKNFNENGLDFAFPTQTIYQK